MCGKFSQTKTEKELIKEFKFVPRGFFKAPLKKEIYPKEPILVIKEENKSRQFDYLNWGLIPSWAKDPSMGERLINARSETLSEKPSFRGPFKNSRCLIVADGFYEWERKGRVRTPYFFQLKSKRAFGLAGLYSHWTSPDGSEIHTCTIITTQANEVIKPIHHRMPVIVPENKRDLWLDSSNYNARVLSEVLSPYPDEEIEKVLLKEEFPQTLFNIK